MTYRVEVSMQEDYTAVSVWFSTVLVNREGMSQPTSYFLPSSCEFGVDIHRCGYCPLSFSIPIFSTPFLFFLSFLQKGVMFSKEWPFLESAKNFVYAISDHKCILVDLTACLNANCTPVYTGPQKSLLNLLHVWAISFTKSCLVQFLEYSLWEVWKMKLEHANSTSSRLVP